MSWFKTLISGTKIVDNITNVVSETVTDKDKRNALVAQIMLVLMNNKVAPYIRGLLAIIIVTSTMFFGDKITITIGAQEKLLYGVAAFYFMDRLGSFFGNKKT